MKLIVGMTGATGAPLGVALLKALREMPEVETHLVMSKWAKTTIELETPYSAREVAALADFSHSPADQALSRMGVAMVPPMPAYYNHPKTIEDVTDHVVTRVLDQFGLEYHKARRWSGLRAVENVSQENE